MGKIREAVLEDAELSRRIAVIADNPPPDSWGKDYNELLVQKNAAMRVSAGREKAQAGRCGGMEK